MFPGDGIALAGLCSGGIEGPGDGIGLGRSFGGDSTGLGGVVAAGLDTVQLFICYSAPHLSVSNRKTEALEICLSATTLAAKLLIRDRIGIDAEDSLFSLTTGGKRLEDALTLEQQGVTSGSTLTVCYRGLGGAGL